MQKSLTLEDLGEFTEDVLLPAMSEMIDQKLEEKLSPIWHEPHSIRQDLKGIEKKIDRIAQASAEDIIAVNTDIKKFEKKELCKQKIRCKYCNLNKFNII